MYDEVIGHCHGSGRIVLRQVTLGHGDVYAQTGIGLDGENASFAANIGYLARKNQTLDMNLVVNHWGKKTKDVYKRQLISGEASSACSGCR